VRQRGLILIATLLAGWLQSALALAQEERLRLEGDVSDAPEESEAQKRATSAKPNGVPKWRRGA